MPKESEFKFLMTKFCFLSLSFVNKNLHEISFFKNLASKRFANSNIQGIDHFQNS